MVINSSQNLEEVWPSKYGSYILAANKLADGQVVVITLNSDVLIFNSIELAQKDIEENLL